MGECAAKAAVDLETSLHPQSADRSWREQQTSSRVHREPRSASYDTSNLITASFQGTIHRETSGFEKSRVVNLSMSCAPAAKIWRTSVNTLHWPNLVCSTVPPATPTPSTYIHPS